MKQAVPVNACSLKVKKINNMWFDLFEKVHVLPQKLFLQTVISEDNATLGQSFIPYTWKQK